jgi:bifunctional enzyme CysN/CysC
MTALDLTRGRRPDVVWSPSLVVGPERWRVTGGPGVTVWITGLSGAGKSSIAREAEHLLVDRGRACYVLDGDNLRHGLNADLGFDQPARDENVRRVGEVARLMADAGLVTLVSLISPYRAGRDAIRRSHEEHGLRFVEVYVATPLAVCEQRDPKGLYAKARRGELTGMTGIDDPYEEPLAAELVLAEATVAAAAARVLECVGVEVGVR